MSNWWDNQRFDLREENRLLWISRLDKNNEFYQPYINIIGNFAMDYAFLSNFHPCKITYKGHTYNDTETAYQAAKVIEGSVFGQDENGKDILWFDKIKNSKDAAEAKKLGAKCPLRPGWEQIKLSVMKDVLAIKFVGTELEAKLLATGTDYLMEGTTWHDNIWGLCIRKNCEKCVNKIGMNYLGLFLMQLRHSIRVDKNIENGINNIGWA